MLQVRLIGPPEVTLDGTSVDPDTRKAIAILAYLVAEGPTARDSLAALFWAESAPDRARATLRRTLSALRSSIGAERVEADQDRVELVGDYFSDLSALDEALDAAGSHGHDSTVACERCVPHLVKAASLYRGEFLEGFSVRDAPDFEDWVRTMSESIRVRLGDSFRRLTMAHADSGRFAEGLAATKSWIDLDPLHEPAHRLNMLLHAWAGNRPAALEAYMKFARILDRELGVSPLEETTELYEAILDEDLPPSPADRRRRRLQPQGRVPASGLVGRTNELNQLREALVSVARGGRVVLLTGSTWMGKTRLIEEIAQQATGEFTVLSGRSFHPEQEIPYGVAAQILTSARGHIDELAIDLPEWVISEVGRIDPRFGRLQETPHVEPFGELRLFEAMRELIAAICRIRPVVLSIDDIQWIDSASASLVSYLAQRIGKLPVLMLFARRDGEEGPKAIANSLSNGTTIGLEPLAIHDLAEFVDDEEVGRQILRSTGGIPLLVVEAVESANSVADSASVLRYMESRLRGLDGLTQQVLASAAVLSGICEPSLLRATSGRSEAEIVAAVEELIQAGLLRELPEAGVLGFALDVIEELVYDTLSMPRRHLLHRRAAEALAGRARAHADLRFASSAAFHFKEAGDDRAAEWFLVAAGLARAAYANDEARHFLELALALGSPDRGMIRLGLGELALLAGDYRAALRELTAAAGHSTGADLARIHHRLGEANRLLGRFDLAAQHFEQARIDHPSPAELLADWALLSHRVDRTGEAIRLSTQAIEVATRLGDSIAGSRAHSVAAVVVDDLVVAMSHLEESLELAGSNDLARMSALNNKAFLLAIAGRPEEAIPLVERAIEISQRTGHVHREAILLNHLADLLHALGEDEATEVRQLEAMKLFADISAGPWEPELWLLRHW